MKSTEQDELHQKTAFARKHGRFIAWAERAFARSRDRRGQIVEALRRKDGRVQSSATCATA